MLLLKSNVSRSWYIWTIDVSRSGYITARDQSMVESGVKKEQKSTASFLSREWSQQLKNEASS